MGFLSLLFAGIGALILDLISGLLVFGGTLLLLFGNLFWGSVIFALGCVFLALSELLALFKFYSGKEYERYRFSGALVDTVIFILASYALPVIFAAVYLFFYKDAVLLILAITSAVLATIKLVFRIVRLLLIRRYER